MNEFEVTPFSKLYPDIAKVVEDAVLAQHYILEQWRPIQPPTICREEIVKQIIQKTERK